MVRIFTSPLITCWKMPTLEGEEEKFIIKDFSSRFERGGQDILGKETHFRLMRDASVLLIEKQ